MAEKKPEKNQEDKESVRQSQAHVDDHGNRTHLPKDFDRKKWSVCKVCNTTFRINRTKRGIYPKYCSAACRSQSTRLRKIAEENYLKAEIEALQRGETQADVKVASAHERAARMREGLALTDGTDPDTEAMLLARESKAKSLLERVRTAKPFSPEEAQRMQAGIADLVEEQIMMGHRVVMGTLSWSPVQARVFAAMLDKCVPNLSASYTKSEQTRINVEEMPRAQLEKIAAEALRTIDAEPVSPAEAEDKEVNDP